ncbi:hypothetical protein SLE2022_327950 [Rubroshorea leprosula]
MMKLVVEVLDAMDLMPKDGQGSASPFVEVDFDEQRKRTPTKEKDLNPVWNEKLVFSVSNPRDLPNKVIEVVVFNDTKASNGHHRNFLGRVKISGSSVPFSEPESTIQRYPLDKRGLFSRIRGDIALKAYVVQDGSGSVSGPPPTETEYPSSVHAEPDYHHEETSFEEINTNKIDEGFRVEEKKSKKKEKEVRTFHSIGTGGGGGPPPAAAAPPPMPSGIGFTKAPVMETKTDFARAGPAQAAVMQVQGPRQNPEYGLEETSPPLAARRRYRAGDKLASTYDLVEQMHYLFVHVVKAKDLPVMDISGSLDPYVEVKVGNYKGVTKHLEKNQSPVWNQKFAFSKERLQSNQLEITVKDKDIGKDDFVGKVLFDLLELPLRVPPDSPLAPQWYRLVDKKGEKVNKGEIMLAVWMGTQADESFPDAWHSDAHNISHSNLANTRSKVYFTPQLYYLRIHVLEAQDLVPSEKGRLPDAFVRVQLVGQSKATKLCPKTINPKWVELEEFIFVASEPFEDFIFVSVEDKVGPGKEEILGRVIIPVKDVPQRHEIVKLPEPRWFSLHKPSAADEGGEKKEKKFSSKILLQIFLEGGYHVLDESTHFSSDLRPSSKPLRIRKQKIGDLDLGILSAKNLPPMKIKDGRTTDAYCVAKYGNKWARTRTLLDIQAPRWNQQYSWEVYDLCTVITIGVFDNAHTNGSKDDAKDQRIGKVRIRLSTLQTNRVYTHYYPLLVLQPSGLKKNGELQLAIRFTCTAWANMVTQYGRPLLPKMHYVQPIPIRHTEYLRYQAMMIVAARLGRAEPPLRKEVVEYMLDVDIHMWSLRRSKANFNRITSLLSGVTRVCKFLEDICYWRNPVTTCLVHLLFLILVFYPELILPTIFLYLFAIGIWNYRFRPRHPPHMDVQLSCALNVHPDELDEEFDAFPTKQQSEIVRMRYDRLRIVAGKVQTVLGDLASQGERAQAILSWRDPRATAIFIIFSLIWAAIIYVTPLQVVAILIGLFWLRHPRLRSKLPSVPVNFFKRLPSKSDMLL